MNDVNPSFFRASVFFLCVPSFFCVFRLFLVYSSSSCVFRPQKFSMFKASSPPRKPRPTCCPGR